MAPRWSFPSLDGRVVLITGASRGLGREMALELAGHGARLAITGRTAGRALEATAAELRALGAETVALAGDLAEPQAAARIAAAAETALGPVEVLVNNAGIGMRTISESFNTRATPFWQVPPEAWARLVETNLNGAFRMAAAVAPGMVARGFGKIVNVSTSAQTMVRRGYSPYGPSKAALEAASRVWAADLAGTGVDLNVYLPGGASDTDFIPPGPDRKGADGMLLPAAIMRRGIGWLAADDSNSHSGGRYIARLWNPELAPAEAAAGARSSPADLPVIL